jgi:hypothetical protein
VDVPTNALDLTAGFTSVFGTQRGSESEITRDLAPCFADLAVGDLSSTLERLHHHYLQTPGFLDRDNAERERPYQHLLHEFATTSGVLAANRWQPHLQYLLSMFISIPTKAAQMAVLADFREWVRDDIHSEPASYIDEVDLDWNISRANSLIGWSLGRVLAPSFLANPQKHVSFIIGEESYSNIDEHYVSLHHSTAAECARDHSEFAWRIVFGMLGEEGLDLQPRRISRWDLSVAFEATFKNLLDGLY